MSNFTLKQDGFTGYTTIPNCFIEQFMPYAAGEFVKIYIYLLKCVGENKSELSISKIADAFNNTEKDVVRALKYWQKKGLLKLTFDEENTLTSLRIVSLNDMQGAAAEPVQEKLTLNVKDAPVPGPAMPAQKLQELKQREQQSGKAEEAEAAVRASKEVPAPKAVPVQPDIPETPAAVPEKREYSRTEILSFANQEEISQLFFVVQRYLGRSLTGQDTGTILYLYEQLQFPVDLIEYLFEYCVNRNHRSIRYIEKTALGWAESGIRTVQGAKLMAGIYSDDCYPVLSAFGLGNRKPTKTESDYVSKWILSYGFDLNMVLIACGKTMDQLHQPSFEYTDAILQNWRSNQVTSPEDIRRLDAAFDEAARKDKRDKKTAASSKTAKSPGADTKFNNFRQRTYDYRELEKKLFNQ